MKLRERLMKNVRIHTRVLVVFSFLKLRSPDVSFYQWIYPTFLLFIAYVGYIYFGDSIIDLHGDELVKEVNGLMGILFGFYIAAIAAISSFKNENLDKELQGREVTLSYVRRGKEGTEKITRRRFVLIIFGYCASLAVLLYAFGLIYIYVDVSGNTSKLFEVIQFCLWTLYFWILSSLLVVTFLGLYYLVDRIHRP